MYFFRRGNMGKSIVLPSELYEGIAERIKETEFKSVDEFVVFVLEEVLKEEDNEEQALTPEEEEQVKERLKGLGYL